MTDFSDIYENAKQAVINRLYEELMLKHNGVLMCEGDFSIKNYNDSSDSGCLVDVVLKNLTCLDDGQVMVCYDEDGDSFSDPIELFSLDEIDGILSVIKNRL